VDPLFRRRICPKRELGITLNRFSRAWADCLQRIETDGSIHKKASKKTRGLISGSFKGSPRMVRWRKKNRPLTSPLSFQKMRHPLTLPARAAMHRRKTDNDCGDKGNRRANLFHNRKRTRVRRRLGDDGKTTIGCEKPRIAQSYFLEPADDPPSVDCPRP
jgi:hypothetical protein